ncbi:hypothetical protein [Enterobacter roggenkampii]|uniref:hypothetical protein n=1 Tax=Enterobacter roggenkampii TaxID=1812935 RepID=UPI002448BFFA|nr:hypothetical protein [Enterobacter roggenkampii]MDH2557133.1 hypothetical protein [Enterobacter roggenkampii]
MTVIRPMTGEQLNELMTVAVKMQRDCEKAGDRPAAMFAYAVQVAVLELRKVRNDAAALAAENAGLKESVEHAAGCIAAAEAEGLIDALAEKDGERLADLIHRRLCHAHLPVETPATDAFLAEVRAQGVEMFAASLGSPYVERGEECYQDGYTHAIERIKCHKAAEFAAQIRKGAQS